MYQESSLQNVHPTSLSSRSQSINDSNLKLFNRQGTLQNSQVLLSEDAQYPQSAVNSKSKPTFYPASLSFENAQHKHIVDSGFHSRNPKLNLGFQESSKYDIDNELECLEPPKKNLKLDASQVPHFSSGESNQNENEKSTTDANKNDTDILQSSVKKPSSLNTSPKKSQNVKKLEAEKLLKRRERKSQNIKNFQSGSYLKSYPISNHYLKF